MSLGPISGRFAAAALAVVAGACSLSGAGVAPVPGAGPGPAERPAAAVAERTLEYGGYMLVDGQSVPVVLRIRPGEDGRIDGSLQIPELALVAHGAGALRDGRLALQLSYGLDCPGQARLEARDVANGRRLEGTLSASDCTGTERAPVVLLLRSGTP